MKCYGNSAYNAGKSSVVAYIGIYLVLIGALACTVVVLAHGTGYNRRIVRLFARGVHPHRALNAVDIGYAENVPPGKGYSGVNAITMRSTIP